MKKTALTLLCVISGFISVAQVSSIEKQTLLDFYLATDGDNWIQSWELNDPVATWPGVTVEDNKVVAISLLFNKLKGELPESIGNLSNLRTLELSFNELSGGLPVTIGKLTQLEVLAFNGNDLTGPIPASIGNLTELKQLHLSSNQFIATLDGSLGKLRKLEVFNVFDNDLEGDLPVGLITVSGLKELMVAENDFQNLESFSVVLLSNSGAGLDLNNSRAVPAVRSVIAREVSDDEN